MSVLKRYKFPSRSASGIAATLEQAIREGALGPGDSLPPIRAAAEWLIVSPATVAAAYRLLATRGLVVGDGRRGTRVTPRPPLPLALPPRPPRGARDLAHGNPDPELLPDLARVLAAAAPPKRLYGEEAKVPQLVSLVERQLERDGVATGPLAIVGGALDGIERVLQVRLRPGDRVAVEDPAFPRVLDLLAAYGLVPEHVAVDDEGPIPAALASALRRRVAAVIVTPRAQNPYGSALTRDRAGTLRRELDRSPDVLVIEDDHAGLVAGGDYFGVSAGRRRWALVRSFAKALGPDLRVAALTGDEETVARVEGRQLLGTGWVSHVLQHAVVALLRDVGTRKLLRRAEHTYTQRRDALIDALAARGIAAHGRSGLNVWVPVREETAAAQALLDRGWAVAGGARFRLRSAPALRITTATLEPADAGALAADLAAALTPSARTYAA